MELTSRALPLGRHRLAHRIVWPAHLTNAARDGLPTAQHAAYYAARAAGGAAMIVTEEHSADPRDQPYEHMIRGTDPRIVGPSRRVTDAVHAHGTVVLAQVGHNGGQSSSLYSRTPVLAPTAIADPMFRETPRAATPADLARLVDGFALTAEHCVAGGYDGVEVQASQASILRQFLSPPTAVKGRAPLSACSSDRSVSAAHDALDERAAPLLRILDAIRARLGPARLLGVRLQGDEGVAGGLDGDDAARVATMVAGRVDYVSTAVGVATRTLPLIEPAMGVPAGYAAHVPSAVRTALAGTGVPVLGVGRFTVPDQVEATLAAGTCDLVGVVRGQIADPAFARRALAGERVRRCIGCNQECIAAVGLNRRLGCVVNPDAGREARPRNTGGPRRRVLVVGGGPAGLAAAVAAARRGDDVEVVEAADALGGQVLLAAAAPERAEIAHVVTDLLDGLDGVRVRLRTVADAGTADGFDVVVDATGSVPVVPAWAGPGVVTVDDVLAGRAHPRGHVVVVDECGGHPAPSTAEHLARTPAVERVTTVTAGMVTAADLGPTLERERRRRRVAELGETSLTDRVVLAHSDGVLTLLHHPTGRTETVPVDTVVVAAHRRARGLAVPGAVRVGDALAPRRLDAAVREGTDAVAP